jgi:endonuclease/exonuclease/phosphatase family metal-dependent hydrolase
MGISGYEVLVMVTVSPFLLAIRSLRLRIVRNPRAVHLLSLVGLLAYLIRSPVLRLFAVGFGVSTACLAWVATWYIERADAARLEAKICAWSVGLIASSVAKFAFRTNNPIWPIVHRGNGGWNGVGAFLAAAAIQRSTRRRAVGSTPTAPTAVSASKRGNGSSPALAGLGVGGLVFALHSLLSDSSTMILWAWEGYPVRGPLAVPHGACTILAMAAGVVLGLFYADVARSWTVYAVACVAAALLTAKSNWTGFWGGLVLAAYLMAMAPTLVASAVHQGAALTFGLGFLVYNFLVLAHVWVVAYAFVPGGPLMREHTDWVMSAMMLFIGAGVFSATALNAATTTTTTTTSTASSSKSRARMAATAAGAVGPAGAKLRSYYMYALGLLQLLAAAIAYLRFPAYSYTPYHADERLLTAGIWTVHFSLDNDMWSSERRMRDALRDLELDVVGLLESDLQRIIMGNRDTTQFLAEDLGMYVDYGPGPNKHTWGAALLSKFPIVNSTHHLLPSPAGELAPAIHATLDAYGTLVDVVVFHSGQDEDAEDRRLQTQYLARLMGGVAPGRPLILLSYLVTRPQQGNYNTYVGAASGMRDIDPSDWDRWCEYILYKGLKRVGYARVSRSTITDTELQVSTHTHTHTHTRTHTHTHTHTPTHTYMYIKVG